MGDNHALDFVAIFPQIGDIRQHNIDPMHPIGGKGEASIQQQDLIVDLKDAGIFPNLVQAPEGNHFQGGFSRF